MRGKVLRKGKREEEREKEREGERKKEKERERKREKKSNKNNSTSGYTFERSKHMCTWDRKLHREGKQSCPVVIRAARGVPGGVLGHSCINYLN